MTIKVNGLFLAFPFAGVLEYIETPPIGRARAFVGSVEPCYAAYARCLQGPGFARANAAQSRTRRCSAPAEPRSGGTAQRGHRSSWTGATSAGCASSGDGPHSGLRLLEAASGQQLLLTHEYVLCGPKGHGWHSHS